MFTPLISQINDAYYLEIILKFNIFEMKQLTEKELSLLKKNLEL